MQELALFAQISLFERCLRCDQLRELNAVAIWQLSRHRGGRVVSGGLGLYMSALVGLQYTGTLPTVQRYVLIWNTYQLR